MSVSTVVAQRSVRIESNLSEAHVFADKKWIGTVAQSPFQIDSDVTEITVVQPQLDLWKATPFVFNVPNGNDHVFSAMFDLEMSTALPTALTNGVGVNSKGKRWISFAAAGTSIAAGMLAIHFRTKADNRFEDYLESGSPALKKRVQRLDVQSGIALGVMQVGVGVIGFRLIF